MVMFVFFRLQQKCDMFTLNLSKNIPGQGQGFTMALGFVMLTSNPSLCSVGNIWVKLYLIVLPHSLLYST